MFSALAESIVVVFNLVVGLLEVVFSLISLIANFTLNNLLLTLFLAVAIPTSIGVIMFLSTLPNFIANPAIVIYVLALAFSGVKLIPAE